MAQQDRSIRPSQEHLIQATANYKSFGSGLRKFLLGPKTIPQATCPKSYLQLLSLRNELDGFLILKNFIFLRSPQLDGELRDFHTTVTSLNITPGEHIRTFYGRAIWLGNEISLANLADGTLAVLHECFLSLLRDTKCSIIIGETSTYWRQIREHRRDPSKIQADLPWSFNEVLRSLETAGVELLSPNNNNHNNISSSMNPSFAASSIMDPSFHYNSTNIYPVACAGHSHHHHQNHHNKSTQARQSSYYRPSSNAYSPTHQHQNIPHKNNNSSPLSIPPNVKEKHLLCKFCNNLHSSPWHSTDHCPLKDPTFIVNKKIRENVMQHNNLYGKENKNYDKNIDLPHTSSLPSKATIPRIAHSATLTTPNITTPALVPDNPFGHIIPPLEDPYLHYDCPSPTDTPESSEATVIDTGIFDVPPPTTNLCSTFQTTPQATYHDLLPTESSPFVDIIMDPTDYLHFSS